MKKSLLLLSVKKRKKVKRVRKKLVDLCIKNLMVKGKRNVAEKKFFKVLRVLQAISGPNIGKIFKRSILNIRPTVAVKILKVAGRRVPVPYHFGTMRSFTTAIKWLNEVSRVKKINGFVVELLKGYLRRGEAFAKNKNLLKIGLENRFSMYHLKKRSWKGFWNRRRLRRAKKYFKRKEPKKMRVKNGLIVANRMNPKIFGKRPDRKDGIFIDKELNKKKLYVSRLKAKARLNSVDNSKKTVIGKKKKDGNKKFSSKEYASNL